MKDNPCINCPDKWYVERHVNCYEYCEKIKQNENKKAEKKNKPV